MFEISTVFDLNEIPDLSHPYKECSVGIFCHILSDILVQTGVSYNSMCECLIKQMVCHHGSVVNTPACIISVYTVDTLGPSITYISKKLLTMYITLLLCADKWSCFVSCRVDFVDGFGRERRCLRKDLPALMKLDENIAKAGRCVMLEKLYNTMTFNT